MVINEAPSGVEGTVNGIRSVRYGDLYLILSCGIALGIVISAIELFQTDSSGLLHGVVGGIRLLLGLPFVLYIPGYLLQGIFFPHQDDLDTIRTDWFKPWTKCGSCDIAGFAGQCTAMGITSVAYT